MDWPESTLPTIVAFPAGVAGTEARSAIIEFAGGEPVVHHGREFTVMTNDPTQERTADIACTAGLFGSK